MTVSTTTVTAITKTSGRKSLFHFTRVANLSAIAHFDALLSSYQLNSQNSGERRLTTQNIMIDEYSITLNAHLKIPDSMMDTAVTQKQFRAYLDRHIFFWPTLADCRKMISSYERREPHERFAVLTFDAFALLSHYASTVKLSKYDSGSAPRYPTRCHYKKSLDMFLPLSSYKIVLNNTVPARASEIKEVLIKDRVNDISRYLQAVYVDHCEDTPDHWRNLVLPLADLRDMNTRNSR